MAQGGIKDANLSCILPDHQLNQLPSARQGEKNQQDQAFSHAVGISIVEATQQNLDDDATMNSPGPTPHAAIPHHFMFDLLAHRCTDGQRGTDSNHDAEHQCRGSWGRNRISHGER